MRIKLSDILKRTKLSSLRKGVITSSLLGVVNVSPARVKVNLDVDIVPIQGRLFDHTFDETFN